MHEKGAAEGSVEHASTGAAVGGGEGESECEDAAAMLQEARAALSWGDEVKHLAAAAKVSLSELQVISVNIS